MKIQKVHNEAVIDLPESVVSPFTPVTPVGGADQHHAQAGGYRIVVSDLVVAWSIGVLAHEHDAVQPVRINLVLDVEDRADWQSDDFATVPCYARLADNIRALAGAGHVGLLETLAHRVAILCLEDPRIITARVRAEKPEALKNAGAVGVELVRSRPAGHTPPAAP